jgi:molecular chaperone GrpE
MSESEVRMEGPSGDGPPVMAIKPAEVIPPADEMKAKFSELEDRFLRMAADFDNYKKRTSKEMAAAALRAREDVLKSLLDIFDNLERAIATPDTAGAADVKKGVEMVLALAMSNLSKFEFKSFSATSGPFNAAFHHAVARVPSASVPEGHIVRQLSRGYLMGSTLIRPAYVEVAAPMEVIP